MKNKKSNKIIILLTVVFVLFCTYVSHDLYWTVYAWIHPDVSRMYEVKFKDLNDEDLQKILKERTSPRTDGAYAVLSTRYEKSKAKDSQ